MRLTQSSFAAPDASAIDLHLVSADDLEAFMESQPQGVQTWLRRMGFKAGLGQAVVVPLEDDAVMAVAGDGTAAARARGRFHLAGAAAKLPAGAYRLVTQMDPERLEAEAIGWLLSSYSFDKYRKQNAPLAQLVAPEGIDTAKCLAVAQGEMLTRDLINTPASDMGPSGLEGAARRLALVHCADCEVTTGDALLAANLPMIHTVGRAADDAPRLIDIRWGHSGPLLTLVGKGVCFDTGGLNIKPGASMGLMKKDMGGAATVLGLAHMIMALGWEIRLRVLIPAVENSISGNAFRPQDVLTSRKGLTVEINNTDAEGRLVLADALALADEEDPAYIISMATLTGAARVAVGPDLAPFFTTDTELSGKLRAAAPAAADPVWEMPFWDGYEAMIEPGIADLDNAPKGGFGGAITAALFLRRFVTRCSSYTHFDIYGWQPSPAPARTKGGTGQGARALLAALPAHLGL